MSIVLNTQFVEEMSMMSLCYCCSQGGLSLILRLIRLHQKSQEVNPAIIRKYLRIRDISLLVRACKYNAITIQYEYNATQMHANTNTIQCKYQYKYMQILTCRSLLSDITLPLSSVKEAIEGSPSPFRGGEVST